MRRDIRIIFAGGGTGGHVFPAIYMADYLKNQWGADCQFIGTKHGIENRKVSQAGYLVRHIWISGFKRGLYLSNLIFPLKLIASMIQSRRILKETRPDLVIGTGGYVAGPVLRQAVKMKIPTAIQEQNSYPGVTTRLLAPSVDCVLLAYKEAVEYLGKLKKYRIVGNPIRTDLISSHLEEAKQYFGLNSGFSTLLIFGGSQGARNINRAIDTILSKKLLKSVQIIWQTGQADFSLYKKKYKDFKDLNLCILPFIDRMDYAYAISDLSISRAGAMTISELAATGLPAILIPLPSAAANHQYKNAKTIADQGGAHIILDNTDLADNLMTTVMTLLATPEQLKNISENIKKFHHPQTMSEIADILSTLIKEKPSGINNAGIH